MTMFKIQSSILISEVDSFPFLFFPTISTEELGADVRYLDIAKFPLHQNEAKSSNFRDFIRHFHSSRKALLNERNDTETTDFSIYDHQGPVIVSRS